MARWMRRINGAFTLFWIAMIPVSLLMGWLSSVSYVSALSLWALVSGHWAAWQSARVEVIGEGVEGRVVDEIVAKTNVKESE